MAIHWEAVEQYFAVALFGFQFFTVCSFGLSTVRSERVDNGDRQAVTFMDPQYIQKPETMIC